MENYIAFLTLSTGSKHKITQETFEQILEAEKDDFIMLPDKTTFKNSAVMEIQDIKFWAEEEAYEFGQPYTALPQGLGYTGIISRITHLKDLEAFARGLQKAKDRFIKEGRTTKKIDEFLRLARLKYSKVQHETNPNQA